MRFGGLLLIGVLLFIGCKSDEKNVIHYKNTYSLQISNLDKKKGKLDALIGFENKAQSTDFKLKDISIDIIIDGIDVGTFYTRSTMDFRAQSQLKTPISFLFDVQKVQRSDGSFPSSFVVQFKGKSTFVDIQGNRSVVRISHKETVKPAKTREQKREDRKTNRQKRKEERKAKKALKKADKK